MNQRLHEILELANTYLHELPPAPPAPEPPTGAAIAGWIDHTLLKPEVTRQPGEGTLPGSFAERVRGGLCQPVLPAPGHRLAVRSPVLVAQSSASLRRRSPTVKADALNPPQAGA
jgi:hypothetical protein